MSDIQKIIERAPPNLSIVNGILRAHSVLSVHLRVAVSVSGGSDSDTIMDLIELVKPDTCTIVYVFFDTGMEFAATKRHLDELESRYNVSIERRRAKTTVAAACRLHGVPFISKEISDMFGRLQRHNFDWPDAAENATQEKYGRCKSALDWYFDRGSPAFSGKSRHSISRFAFLKEFVSENPPDFKISDKCCYYAKKSVSHEFYKTFSPDLSVTGMRRAEGGKRAGTGASCFFFGNDNKPDNYRPIWYWSDEDKAQYKAWRGLTYSDCYEVWGLKRTGCAGCPCNSKALHELEIIKQYEPQLVKAAYGVFGKSYDYRAQYIEFKERQKRIRRSA